MMPVLSTATLSSEGIGPFLTAAAIRSWAHGLQVFQPYVCDMREWDQADFLQCTANHQRVIMVGDMSMHQMFNSMACLLSDAIVEGSQTPWEVGICSSELQIGSST